MIFCYLYRNRGGVYLCKFISCLYFLCCVLSLHISFCLSISLSVYPSFQTLASPFIHQCSSIHPSVLINPSISAHQSIHQCSSIHPSVLINPSIRAIDPFIFTSIHLSILTSILTSVHSICMSVHPSTLLSIHPPTHRHPGILSTHSHTVKPVLSDHSK